MKFNIIRLLDFFFAAVALVFLLPVFIIVIPILKFTGEGEVFYRQPRIGLNSKKFNILKFATMKKDSPNMEGGTLTVEDDPRILPLGHFLRSSKINELPQIINILIGDMSIIGPRPLTEEIISYYNPKSRDEILSTRPGLSGIGSIIFRNEQEILSKANDRHNFYLEFIAPYKMTLETWYIQNKSIILYLKLIYLTAYAVLFKSSQLHWKLFSDLPKPPKQLYSDIGYLKNKS